MDSPNVVIAGVFKISQPDVAIVSETFMFDGLFVCNFRGLALPMYEISITDICIQALEAVFVDGWRRHR
jgi:hypothetical protein